MVGKGMIDGMGTDDNLSGAGGEMWIEYDVGASVLIGGRLLGSAVVGDYGICRRHVWRYFFPCHSFLSLFRFCVLFPNSPPLGWHRR